MARARWDRSPDSHSLVLGLLKSRAVALSHRDLRADITGEVVVEDCDVEEGNACRMAESSSALSC